MSEQEIENNQLIKKKREINSFLIENERNESEQIKRQKSEEEGRKNEENSLEKIEIPPDKVGQVKETFSFLSFSLFLALFI